MGESTTPGEGPRGAAVRDIAVVVTLIAIVIAIGVHAPGHSYAYAQMRQMGATLGMIDSNNWLLPRNHEGGLARKPQLYSWLTAPVLLATGVYADLTYRWVSVAAGLACGVLIYLLARRWYGRRVGLLAACLWATCLHMSKLLYLGTTDMLHTLWLTAAVFCADRLLFHRAPRPRRGRWAAGLWAAVILGAMTKGWGVANVPILAFWIATTTGVAPGFKVLRAGRTWSGKCALAACLLIRRWRRAVADTRLGWGMLAFAAVLGPVWWGMFAVGGKEFLAVIDMEILKRTVGGENAPGGSSLPPVLWLFFYTLPASVFALGALVLDRPRRWLARGGRLGVALWWILAVVIPFSLTHGFRPDYLLPCYGAVAMIGAVGIEHVQRLGKSLKRAVVLHHLYAAAAVALGVIACGLGLTALAPHCLPESLAKALYPAPLHLTDDTVVLLACTVGLGLAVVIGAIWASLLDRMFVVAILAIVATVCILFVYQHVLSRHARTCDGETTIAFARKAGKLVGGDPFAVARCEKIGTELYWGRMARLTLVSQQPGTDRTDRFRTKDNWLDAVRSGQVRWVITCDAGLVRLGRARQSAEGRYILRTETGKVRLRTLPESLGRVEPLGLDRPITQDNMGRVYLIRVPGPPPAR